MTLATHNNFGQFEFPGPQPPWHRIWNMKGLPKQLRGCWKGKEKKKKLEFSEFQWETFPGGCAGGNSAFFLGSNPTISFSSANSVSFPPPRGCPKLHWPSVFGVHSATSTVAFEDVRGLFEDVGWVKWDAFLGGWGMDGGPVVVLTKVKLWKKAKLVFNSFWGFPPGHHDSWCLNRYLDEDACPNYFPLMTSSNQLLWSSNQPHTNHPPIGSNLRLSQGWTPKDTFGKRWFSTQHFAHSANGRGANLEFWDRKTQPGQHTTVGCRGLSITFE